ncbi:hypothetical protein [Nesterenkonia alba]|uniref:hypothetical protein n=1 Tax=Nesterenkonia alba TaxID=515814 RepID=UPI0003B4041C|nr:hypothetical protein [Nesterenkonia alba]
MTKRTTTSQARIRALLAAGLVVGLGGAYVVASWTTQEYLGVSVTTGDFEVAEPDTSADDTSMQQESESGSVGGGGIAE